MSFKTGMSPSTEGFSQALDEIAQAIREAEAIVVGIGAGLSTAAGLRYDGERFGRYFADFRDRFGIRDIYSGGFYPFPDERTYWAWWSRHIFINRYVDPPKPIYPMLLALLRGRAFFVITTNVDHQLQRAGFPKERLFYTQGDYGLWQCATPCHQKTYDNEKAVRAMLREQDGMQIPAELVPRCPVCGGSMTMNLRADDRFVEDEGWHRARDHYTAFRKAHQTGKVLYFELGIGGNTPIIIKVPFQEAVHANPEAHYVCVNLDEAYAPAWIAKRSICLAADLGLVLPSLSERLGVI